MDEHIYVFNQAAAEFIDFKNMKFITSGESLHLIRYDNGKWAIPGLFFLTNEKGRIENAYNMYILSLLEKEML